VIDQVGINCADYPKSQAFYNGVLAAGSLHEPRLWPE
jgi:catechol 2,3-dioxygenase-like lactoylglutathione lyase family enzyme